jgi:DNA replication initiation complex subunit (GINS family)
MYNKLYNVWKKEIENVELEKLPSNFYPNIASYLRSIKKESRMLDQKSIKSNLLERELKNVKKMLHELVWTRYQKLIKKVADNQKVPVEILTLEEKKVRDNFHFTEAYQEFAKALLQGSIKTNFKRNNKRVVLRFLSDVPTLIGVDMKTYGPFGVEEIASLPIENAKLLIKQKLAEKIDF